MQHRSGAVFSPKEAASAHWRQMCEHANLNVCTNIRYFVFKNIAKNL